MVCIVLYMRSSPTNDVIIIMPNHNSKIAVTNYGLKLLLSFTIAASPDRLVLTIIILKVTIRKRSRLWCNNFTSQPRCTYVAYETIVL